MPPAVICQQVQNLNLRIDFSHNTDVALSVLPLVFIFEDRMNSDDGVKKIE